MKPNQIISISYDENFADCWTIVVEFNDGCKETLTCSDNPSHPQGVFGMEDGDYSTPENMEKEWNEIPKTLKEFLIKYIRDWA